MGKRLASIGKILAVCLSFGFISVAFAQNGRNGRVPLAGNVRPAATPANDQGRVDASLLLHRVTLMLPPSVAQQADLNAFLDRLQDPASADFHRFLTPEQYGARFGASDADIARVTSWLRTQNLAVDSVGRGRTTIAFTGAVRDVEKAFATEIHHYSVSGEMHYANSGEPSLPAELGGAVRWIRGLDDFRMQPIGLKRMENAATPSYTSQSTGSNAIAPGDMATMFDINPLFNSGITGAGQSIVVVGQTDINISDIRQFRSYFMLSPNDPQLLLIPHSIDPGVSAGDLSEADIDLEWSGAIAPDATIIYVYAQFVNDALDYAINENIAPVITMSYGQCEELQSSGFLDTMRTYAQQAAAQGISWMAASGDTGANGCYGQATSRGLTGLSVVLPAVLPEVTSVGGTTLSDDGGFYWSSSNNGSHASALSYIPETAWNDSVLHGGPEASTGGPSHFYSKPAWQTGPGVPDDGFRDVPDVAMPASADHDGFMVYTSGLMEIYGGTSVSSPVFAGVTALMSQYLVANGLATTAALGNLNPRLYALAQSAPSVFHDITTGDNMVASCSPKETNCVATQVGFSAGPGYDQVTGLGSVDVYNLVSAWIPPAAATAIAMVTLSSSSNPLSATASTVLTAAVTAASGNTPTGNVTFALAGTILGTAKLTGTGLTATATLTVTAAQLTVGPAADPGGLGTPDVSPAVTAFYSGDSANAPGAASVTIVVVAPTATAVTGVTNAASFVAAYAPGAIVSVFGANLATGAPPAPGSPLPVNLADATVTLNNIPAPLYYVSPSQINLQIPYEIQPNSTAIVKASVNGQTATYSIGILAAAPGIFADSNRMLVPYQSTGRGQSVVLYETGDGLLTPQPKSGSVPDSVAVPVPVAPVSVTVGGVKAATPFDFIGVPSWSIGVTQINFKIPATAPLGLQPVVVTVGGFRSFPAFITVTP